MANQRIAELEELFASHSQFLWNQPATRSIFHKITAVLKEHEQRLRDLEKRFEDTEG